MLDILRVDTACCEELSKRLDLRRNGVLERSTKYASKIQRQCCIYTPIVRNMYKAISAPKLTEREQAIPAIAKDKTRPRHAAPAYRRLCGRTPAQSSCRVARTAQRRLCASDGSWNCGFDAFEDGKAILVGVVVVSVGLAWGAHGRRVERSPSLLPEMRVCASAREARHRTGPGCCST